MLKKRLIPCLLLQNGQLVKSTRFEDFQILGNPKIAIQFFNTWSVDEIIFLDISRTKDYTSLLRRDYNFKFIENFIGIVKECAKICFVPLTIGGGIRNINDAQIFFQSGADKISINSQAIATPDFISEAANKFGSQAVVVSIDARRRGFDNYEVFTDYGDKSTGMSPEVWAKRAEELGAGEILINSIDRDGTLEGYDLNLIDKVLRSVNIPVIACGGAGKWEDMVEGLKKGASAVSAANIFHFSEQSTKYAKDYLAKSGIDVRI